MNQIFETVFVNLKMETMLGYEPGEMLGKTVDSFMAKNEIGDHERRMERRKEGERDSYERVFLKKDGSIVWTVVSATPLFDDKGLFMGSFAMITDITSQKNLESKIEKAEDLQKEKSESILKKQKALLELSKGENQELAVAFRQITEQVNEILDVSRTSIWVYNADKTALQCEDIYLGKEGVHSRGSMLFADDYPVYLHHLEHSRCLAISDALTDKRSLEFLEHYLLPNSIMSLLDTPIRSEGKMTGILCCEQTGETRKWTPEDQEFASSATDIISSVILTHQRKLAEKALLESEEKYRKIVDHAVIGIYKTNLIGQVLFINQAMVEMFEYTNIEDAILTGVEILYKDQDDRKAFLATLVKEKVVRNYELELITRQGNSRFVLINAFFEGDQILGMIMDITRRKKTEEEVMVARQLAEESDRLKTSLMANMSHEFRTPMNAILGFSELIASESQDPNLVFYARKIHTSGQRLMSTLKAILDLADLEATRAKIRIIDINIQKTILSVLRPFYQVANDKGLYLITEISEGIQVLADENLLQLVLNYLIDNAIKFTNQGGVTIETDMIRGEQNEWVLVKIKDTGIGIPREHFDLIFNEFKQLSEGYNRSYEGNGLGLTLARKMTEMIKGKITVDSEVGLGSIFTLWIPASDRPPVSLTEIETENTPEQAVATFSIQQPDSLPLLLIVEDNDDNAEIVKLYLKGKYRLDRAADGFAALRAVAEKQYAGILMDINLGPGMDGLKTAREIKKLNNYTNIPIIAITGYTMAGDREKLLEGGCSHYLGKPFSQQGLIEIINGIFTKTN